MSMGTVGVVPGTSTIRLNDGSVYALDRVFASDVYVRSLPRATIPTSMMTSTSFSFPQLNESRDLFIEDFFEPPQDGRELVLERCAFGVRVRSGWRWAIHGYTLTGAPQHTLFEVGLAYQCYGKPDPDGGGPARFTSRRVVFTGVERTLVPSVLLESFDELAVFVRIDRAVDLSFALHGVFIWSPES